MSYTDGVVGFCRNFARAWVDLGACAGFELGPTLATERLLEVHGPAVSRETLRKWMAAAGLWTCRQERVGKLHQPRKRRDCLGELIQVDGCEHAWFEERGPPCTLLGFVDDATTQLMERWSCASQ